MRTLKSLRSEFPHDMSSAALRSGKKIVYTEHGNFGFGRKITFRDRIKFWLLGKFLKRVDFLSFNSVFTKSFAESRYNLQSVNRGVVYNGIRFDSAEEPIDDQLALSPYQEKLTGNFVVGTTSRFAGFKRVDRLISAFADFATGKNNVKLLLVGDGPTRPELERMVTAKGMNTQVIFTGFQKQVARFQQAMDVCVFASENEPFGLVAVETLKLGKPTVVFRSGGIAEIIEPICKEDVVESNEQLAERLNDYHGNHRKICEPYEARKEYARRFCISIMSSSFIKIYHEIVG